MGCYPVSFGGAAGTDEIADFRSRLKLLAEENAIRYEAVDRRGDTRIGICKIANLKFEETANPRTIRFSGWLIRSFDESSATWSL
jgi:hypothetical protein